MYDAPKSAMRRNLLLPCHGAWAPMLLRYQSSASVAKNHVPALEYPRKAPHRLKMKPGYKVNEEFGLVRQLYGRLCGKEDILEESVAWQAITLKSYNHGRSPYNEWLALFGKRFMNVELVEYLMNRDTGSPNALNGKNMDALGSHIVVSTLTAEKITPIARDSGLLRVMRWIPRDPDDLPVSGEGRVALDCLHAIVGAVAMKKGYETAREIVAQRIFPTLFATSKAATDCTE